MCISDYIQLTFFYLERFLKKLADDQCSAMPFSMEVDWPKIGRLTCLMEVLCSTFARTYFFYLVPDTAHIHIH